jgi:hypothetical protein
MSKERIAFSIIIFIAVVVYTPLMSLWALETIFQVKITYSVWSWLAMSWIHLIIFLAKSSPNTSPTTNTPNPDISNYFNKKES